MFIRKLVRADLTPLSLVNEQNELLSRFTDLSENKHTDNLNAIVELMFLSFQACPVKKITVKGTKLLLLRRCIFH